MRDFIETLSDGFADLHSRSFKIIESTPADKIFWQPNQTNDASLFPINSVGEMILRSAGKVEQTFGGLTARLWDDPFEWTLPESFKDNAAILQYLGEVEATRQKGFGFLSSDEDLRREIPAPENLIAIFQILLDTLLRAENFYSRAELIRQFWLGCK